MVTGRRSQVFDRMAVSHGRVWPRFCSIPVSRPFCGETKEFSRVENLELDLSKLTDSAQRVLTRAEDEARRRGQDLLTSEHLFIAFAQVEWALYARIMRDLAINPDDVLNAVAAGLQTVPQLATGTLRATELTQELLRRSIQSAINAGREQAESFDLFVSILEEHQSGP